MRRGGEGRGGGLSGVQGGSDTFRILEQQFPLRWESVCCLLVTQRNTRSSFDQQSSTVMQPPIDVQHAQYCFCRCTHVIIIHETNRTRADTCKMSRRVTMMWKDFIGSCVKNPYNNSTVFTSNEGGLPSTPHPPKK